MTSRTPIRLTPHRGPLATPTTSPESSPTSSSPPTDISCCTIAVRPTIDVIELEHQISTPSPLTRHSYSRLYRRKRGGSSTRPSPLNLVFESLVNTTNELAKTLAGVVTFCLFLWALLEWSSYVSELPQQPRPWLSVSRFPFPHHTRAPRCHTSSSLCEPREQYVAVLQFLFEQIQHAKALSSLSVGLGLPLRTFFEAHRATNPSVVVLHNSAELPLVQEVDVLANLTKSLDVSFLDFTQGSFIGRSLSLALEELDDLISSPLHSRSHQARGGSQNAHLHAIYWRTASNLLLEYSAARPRARRLLQHLQALHRRLSLLAPGHHVAGSVEGGLNIWWSKSVVRQPAASPVDGLPTFVTGLEVTIDNVHRLVAYLDWITEYLAQTTLKDVLKMRRRSDFSSCMMSLEELFARSKPPIPKKHCYCLNEHGVILSNRPERVEIMVPGSTTVQAER